MSVHVKLKMFIGHVLRLSYYRKKLRNLSLMHLNCGPKFAIIESS